MSYTVGIWELVALVILPFLFGLLFGMHVYERKMIIKLMKEIRSQDLGKIFERGKEGT